MKKYLLLLVVTSIVSAVSMPAHAQFDALRKLGRGIDSDNKQIAYFKIKGALIETPTSLPPLFGSEPPASLKGLLERFKEARRDNNVVAVVVDLQGAALGAAQLQEIHQSLRQFSAVDKEVYVHADTLTTMTYTCATAASHISIVPTGDLWLLGIRGETPYLRGLFDKIGVVPDFEQCGDFKSAAESLTRTGPSDESRKMTSWLFDGIYEGLVTAIAEGRGMSAKKVRSLIDGGPYTAEEALEAGLIDSVQHRQDFIAELKDRYGSSAKVVIDYGKKDGLDLPQDPFAMFSWLMQMFNPSPKVYSKPSVAIVYVEGTIQTGTQQVSPFGSTSGAFSTNIRKALDKAAGDNSVKAVVLRIDSPGGSALASEIILDATRRVADKKPLIVSMGNVAASGGYYVTCASETIFADRSTITASIGVIGGKLVTTGMWDKLGVTWSSIQRGEMAGMLSTSDTFSDAERAQIRKYMDGVYETFKGHVTAARGDRLVKPIDDIAGGRVFTGDQALDLGLIDKIGGLEDAIKFAAQRAKLGDYDIRVIPEPPNIFDLLMGGKGGDEYTTISIARSVSYAAAASPGVAHLPLVQSMLSSAVHIDPLRAAAMLRLIQGIDLIAKENVVTMMPTVWVIR